MLVLPLIHPSEVCLFWLRSRHVDFKERTNKFRQNKTNNFTIPATLRPRTRSPQRPSGRLTNTRHPGIESKASCCTRRRSPFGAAGLALDLRTIPIPTPMMKSENQNIIKLMWLILIGPMAHCWVLANRAQSAKRTSTLPPRRKKQKRQKKLRQHNFRARPRSVRLGEGWHDSSPELFSLLWWRRLSRKHH